jgi:hypothetical protein
VNASTAAAPVATATNGETNHLYCCDEDRGLCGTDLTGHAEVTDVNCVVCVDLDDSEAPCGPGCPLAVSA